MCKSNIRKTWGLIRDALSVKLINMVMKSMTVGGVEVCEELAIANQINPYFTNIAIQLRSIIPSIDASPGN